MCSSDLQVTHSVTCHHVIVGTTHSVVAVIIMAGSTHMSRYSVMAVMSVYVPEQEVFSAHALRPHRGGRYEI